MAYGIIANGATGQLGPLPSAAFSPEVYDTQLRMLLRYNTYMTEVTNRRYEGKLKGRGSKLTIPGEPNVINRPYVPGQPLVTQVNPKGADVSFIVNRGRYVQTGLLQETQYFSSIGNLEGVYKNSGIAGLEEVKESEFIDHCLAAPHSANTGNANGLAGYKSTSYLVGTQTKPILIFDSYGEQVSTAGAAAAAPFKGVAAKILSRLESVLNEQPKNREMNGMPWVYAPEWFMKAAQLSDITLASSDQSNSMSYFFRNVGEVKGIGGFQKSYRSNLLTPTVSAGGAGSTVYAWPVIFGTTDAICYADELDYEETGVSESQAGRFTRRVNIYDWHTAYSEAIGVAWVTPTDYTAA